jgi:4-hydroxy-tetrahydrodipicolinate synthase
MKKLGAIIPPLVTPFDENGEFDEAAMRAQIRFFLEKGIHGICVGGSTGEGYTLTLEEFRRLVQVTTDEVRGKVPVVAGIIANSTKDCIDRAKAVRQLDLAALQITPTFYIFKPDEDATVEHFRELTEAVDLPVIIYNVIRWNILTADHLVRIMTEVPRVIGVKQSGGEIKLLADLLIKAPPDKLIFTAQDALLYPTFLLGAHGAIAANPAAAPTATLALWYAVKRGDHATALELHKRMLRFWNSIAGDNMPSCVKYALILQGCPAGLPRRPMRMPSPQQKAAIESSLAELLDYVATLGQKTAMQPA